MKPDPAGDPLVWRLQIGFREECWPNSVCPAGVNTGRPKFVVVYENDKRGQWTRRNRAVTKWEIKGVRDRANLRICWNYDGSVAENFVSELGSLTVIGATPMQEAQVKMFFSSVHPFTITLT